MELWRADVPTYCHLVVYVLSFFCLQDSVLGGSIIKPPSNTAAKLHDRSLLHCTVDRTGDSLYWTFFPNGTGTGERLYTYNDDNEDKPDPNYDVDPSGTSQGIFDLIVLDTTVTTAGIYVCGLFESNKKEEARFVSVAPATCYPPPGDNEVLEGATVILTCDVSYTGYKPPMLTWFVEGSSAPLQGEWLWNYERSTFYANVTAVPDLDMVEFTCELNFVTDPGDPGDAPNYNDTCSTHFFVLHGATRITIVPDPNGVVNVEVGETINCSASGRPYPSFSWEGDDGEIFLGKELPVKAEWADQQKIFTCYARNEVYGQPHEASLNIEIFVTNPEPEPQEPSSASVEPWVIAVAVIIPLAVLAVAGGGGYAYVKRSSSRPASRPHNDTNGPPAPSYFNTRNPAAQQRQSMVLVANTPVLAPPGSDTEQNRRRERDSPGYGDLGIKHFPSTTSGLNASSVTLDPDPLGGPQKAFGGSQSSLGAPILHLIPKLPPRPFSDQPSDVMNHQSSNQNIYNQSLQNGMISPQQETRLRSQNVPTANNNISNYPDTSV